MFDLGKLAFVEEQLLLRERAVEVAKRCTRAALDARQRSEEQLEASQRLLRDTVFH